MERAETFYNNLINISLKSSKKLNDFLYPAYCNLAIIFYKKGLIKEALSYYQKSLEIGLKHGYEKGSNYNGIASCSFLLGDTIKAERYYKLAIRTRKDAYGPMNPLLAFDYQSYGVFLHKIRRVSEGFSYIKAALEINRENFGDKYPETSKCYSWLGSFFLNDGKPEQSLEYFQRAIICAAEGFDNRDISSNPDLSGEIYGPELLKALKYKADALDSVYRKNKKNKELLSNELATYELALKVIHKLRTSFPEFNSKLLVSGNENNTYLGAVNAAIELYRQTGNAAYKTKAFEFAEKSRSAILLSSFKEKQAIKYGGLPDSLLKKEHALGQAVESFQGLMLEEKQKSSPNNEVMKELETKIFQLKNQQNLLISRFEKEFPQYYLLKYDDRVLNIAAIQKRMSPKGALLEYAITDLNIFIFVITKDKFELIPVSRTPFFDENLKILNTYLHEVNFIGQQREEYESFINAAYFLYKDLIYPAKSMISGKELIIIPDELLASVPFEVLLTRKADPVQEFGDLPYLVLDHAIGYAYSANLLFFASRRPLPEKVRLAAFSPSYTYTVRGKSNEPTFKPLIFAKEEAQAAGSFFKGKVYTDNEATESNFKNKAERYDILHLAMHAIMDNENPMYSKLAFTQEQNSKEDGNLNTYELFNLKLKARMTVLSACNTGAGTLLKGEGIMSLARGFYYAGCPDVVMTLWPVEDKMSTQLIKDFYTYLSQGVNKIEALRLAKLKLITSSDPLRSHPFFWAAYVNIGDISPLIVKTNKKPTLLVWALIAGVCLLLVAPVLWKKLRG